MIDHHSNFTAAIKMSALGSASANELKKVLKRLFDIVVSSAAILILSPIFIGTAILIKLESRGPVIFKQTRVGLNGVPFTIFKFRSMADDAESRLPDLMVRNDMENGVLFKIKSDPRVTKVGKIIRKSSIDELPQLFNVLWGDMSLVGPRPPLPEEVDQYSQRAYLRFAALPGITCFWQVMGRSDIPFKQQVTLDLEYIEKQSLFLDLKLLLMTIPAVLSARGAY